MMIKALMMVRVTVMVTVMVGMGMCIVMIHMHGNTVTVSATLMLTVAHVPGPKLLTYTRATQPRASPFLVHHCLGFGCKWIYVP